MMPLGPSKIPQSRNPMKYESVTCTWSVSINEHFNELVVKRAFNFVCSCANDLT